VAPKASLDGLARDLEKRGFKVLGAKVDRVGLDVRAETV
jgi:hypothetical protein